MRTWTNHHQCATCKFWGGQRSVQKDPREVEYSGLGTCASPKNSYRAKKLSGNTNVSGCWECWECLKE